MLQHIYVVYLGCYDVLLGKYDVVLQQRRNIVIDFTLSNLLSG